MSDSWFEIGDADTDAGEIARAIRARIAARRGEMPADDVDPAEVARQLRQEMIGGPADDSLAGRMAALRPRDCDIVPRQYTIDWRTPILGPIHALVRRIINDEVRRYLEASLEKQSSLNRALLRAVAELVAENEQLRQRIDELESEP
ncbi:MAG: hypothetical protein JXA09_00660 [Anaerolineae bacterium]|nr:hypothetical protein [Anaerolineae bacterium]